jgi:ribosome-associated protein
MAVKKTISAATSPIIMEEKSKKNAAKPARKAVAKTAKTSRSSATKTAAKKTAKPVRQAGGKAPAKKSALKQSGKTSTVKKAQKPEKNPSQPLIDAIVDGILEIKGKYISVLDLTGLHNRVCDYYVICQADSSTQVNAIADSVEETVKKRINERPYHSEGFQNSEWILIDYVTVVVHVFQSHIREFYNLEALWADAEVTKIAFD